MGVLARTVNLLSLTVVVHAALVHALVVVFPRVVEGHDLVQHSLSFLAVFVCAALWVLRVDPSDLQRGVRPEPWLSRVATTQVRPH